MNPAVLRGLFIALFIGAVGGTVFYFLSLPLAWMLGSMIAVMIAALAGAPVRMPNRFRGVFATVIGVLLGSAFTPELIQQAGRFGATLLIQIGFMAVAMTIAYWIYRKVGGYDRTTAYFSSTPGGLSEMTMISEAMGGDGRIVPLNHGIRIVLVVTLISFYFRYVENLAVPTTPQSGAHIASTPLEIALLVACAVIGWGVGSRLRLPAAPMIGPMVLSASLHATGVTNTTVPVWLVSIALVVIGTSVGCRFRDRMSARAMVRTIAIAVLTAVSMIAFAVVTAMVFARLTGLDGFILFLSIAPGGLAEMSLIAFALSADTAFVTVMHFLRVLVVMLSGAAVYRLIFRRAKTAD
ncbi:MAG: AbrB family transcriptional regulator [Alphaproteobacteria bacterium]|nr:AbrB family transcriptional regulator [Alphaproteobacteria bacterium]